MEKDGKVRILDTCYVLHQKGMMLAEVRIQVDVLPGFESILGHCNFGDLDVGDAYRVDYEKDGDFVEA